MVSRCLCCEDRYFRETGSSQEEMLSVHLCCPDVGRQGPFLVRVQGPPFKSQEVQDWECAGDLDHIYLVLQVTLQLGFLEYLHCWRVWLDASWSRSCPLLCTTCRHPSPPAAGICGSSSPSCLPADRHPRSCLGWFLAEKCSSESTCSLPCYRLDYRGLRILV